MAKKNNTPLEPIMHIDGVPVYYHENTKPTSMQVSWGPKYPNASYQGNVLVNWETGVSTTPDGSPIVHPEPDKVGIYEMKFAIVGTHDKEMIHKIFDAYKIRDKDKIEKYAERERLLKEKQQ